MASKPSSFAFAASSQRSGRHAEQGARMASPNAFSAERPRAPVRLRLVTVAVQNDGVDRAPAAQQRAARVIITIRVVLVAEHARDVDLGGALECGRSAALRPAGASPAAGPRTTSCKSGPRPPASAATSAAALMAWPSASSGMRASSAFLLTSGVQLIASALRVAVGVSGGRPVTRTEFARTPRRVLKTRAIEHTAPAALQKQAK